MPVRRPCVVGGSLVLGATTQFSYDANGNLLTLTDARGGSTTDPIGSLTRVTDRLGLVTTYEYDALNRLVFTGY